MTDRGQPDFYTSYRFFKGYETPGLKPKHIRDFDFHYWEPAECEPGMATLEIGAGTGQFLLYLHAKEVGDFVGIDHDHATADHVPSEVRENFEVADVWAYLDKLPAGRTFDRVVLFDVLEHFSYEEGCRLLARLREIMAPSARIVVRVPNMGSPWGGIHQYGDITHRAGYNPISMRQLALASGFECIRCYPHITGSPSRRFLDRVFHGILSRVLMTQPEIWSANFYAVLELR